MRRTVVETAVRCSPPGKAVIAHVGAARMSDALDLARHAAGHGVCAVSSLPPQGGYGFDEIRAYYAALAGAGEAPVVVYFYPEVAPGISPDQVADLCRLRNVVGVKFTSFELHRIPEIRRTGAFVLNGRDEVFAAGMLMGASGGIGSFYNLVPGMFCEVFRAASRGAWDQARPVQDRISELISIVLRYPMIPALKKMLEWSGVPCGAALGPRRRLLAAEEDCLRGALERSGFDPAGFPC
jgi:N-acetylneuraminate lyase